MSASADPSLDMFITRFEVYHGEKLQYTSPEFVPQLKTELPPPGAQYPEGSELTIKFYFRVPNRDIKGLKAERKVFRYSVCVNTETTVYGDYSKSDKEYVFEYPVMKTPTGFFVRANYRNQYTFTDENNQQLFFIGYTFSIVSSK